MPNSFGYRARTRKLFAKGFRQHGTIGTQKFLKIYKLGQIVDIVGDAAQQKGMPHKFYHGKTGVVWNVTPRAVGVVVNKQVGNKILAKRIHVRIEHVNHSKCRQDFLDRVKANAYKIQQAKKTGVKAVLKRSPAMPRSIGLVKVAKTKVVTLQPEAYAGLDQR